MNNASGGNIIFHFKGDTKGLSSSMGGLTKSFTLGNLAAMGISKALQIMSNYMGDAIKRVDTMRNFPKVMKAFGVSTKESEASIKRMDKAMRGLPTRLDEAVSGVRDFFMVTKNLKQSEAMFKAVNDSALIFANGSKDAIQRFIYAYKQSLAAGKVDAQNFRQMNEAIPGVMDKVAQSMGMSMNELKEGLSDGSISMEQFNAELIKLDTKGGAGMKSFASTAKTATAGIETTIENMRSAFIRGITDIILKVDGALKPFGGLAGVIKTVGKVGEQVFGVLAQMIAFSIPQWMALIKIVSKLKPLLIAIGVIIAGWKIGMVVQGIVQGFQQAQISLALFSMEAKGVTLAQAAMNGTLKVTEILVGLLTGKIKLAALASAAWAKIQAGLNAVMAANPIALIVLAIIALVAIFVVLWKKCAAFRNFWKGVWNSIVKAVKPVIDSIKKTFDTQLKPALDNLMKALKQLWTALQPIVNFIITVVIAYIKMVIQQIQFLWNILQPIIMLIINILGVLIQVVIAVISTIINVISSIISFIAGIVSAVVGFIQAIINFIANFGKKLVSFITKDIPNFINGIVTWFAQLPGKIWQFISQLPGKIGQAIGNMVTKAKQKIPQVVSAILNKLKSLPGKVLSIGADIVKGIGKGITNGIKWIKGVIKRFVGSVVDFAKKILHIGSPSKLMEDEIGQWIPKGIAVGIEANADSISKTMSQMGDMLTSSFGLDPSVANSMANNYSPTVNTTVNVNQTQDPLGRMVNDVKTFSGGSRQDYNYGLGG